MPGSNGSIRPEPRRLPGSALLRCWFRAGEYGTEKLHDERGCQKAGLTVEVNHRIYLNNIEAYDLPLTCQSLQETADLMVQETVDGR